METLAIHCFSSEEFLKDHILKTMQFYGNHDKDLQGGFYHYFMDDGTVYNHSHRHLVSSTRFIYNYAMAFKLFGNNVYLEKAIHGLDYLRNVHRNPVTGGYAWTVTDGKPDDITIHCYGLAFALLAYSVSVQASIVDASIWIDETWNLLEKYFWDNESQLYRDEADEQFNFLQLTVVKIAICICVKR